MKRKIPAVMLALSLVLPSYSVGNAADFPPKLITMVVPFAPGGPTDLLGRQVAGGLAQHLKVPVIVENKGGVGGVLGTQYAARAKADGSTLLFNATTQVTNVVLSKTPPYDIKKDFTAIALVATIQNALAIHPSVPVSSVAELISEAKSSPNKFSVANFGGSNQLSAELFMSMAGVRINQIPYKGAGPAMNDVVGGHVSMIFSTVPMIVSHVRAGRLRVLGVTSSERSLALPDIPTIAESGLPGYEAISWFGVFMPATTDKQLQGELVSAVAEALKSKDTQEKLSSMGFEPGKLTGDDFGRFVNEEHSKWAAVVERAGIERK